MSLGNNSVVYAIGRETNTTTTTIHTINSIILQCYVLPMLTLSCCCDVVGSGAMYVTSMEAVLGGEGGGGYIRPPQLSDWGFSVV